MGPGLDRGGLGDRPSVPPPQPTRCVSAPGRHQRRACGRCDSRSDRLVADRCPVRPNCLRSVRRRLWPSTAPSLSARCRAPRLRWLWWTSWTWITITRSTPREPICFGGWAGTARPRSPTSGQPRSRRRAPSGTSSGSVAELRAERTGDFKQVAGCFGHQHRLPLRLTLGFQAPFTHCASGVAPTRHWATPDHRGDQRSDQLASLFVLWIDSIRWRSDSSVSL